MHRTHKVFPINKLRQLVLLKKSVAKAAGLSYFHTQLHRMVPGRSDSP
jgi:hypothetical protein